MEEPDESSGWPDLFSSAKTGDPRKGLGTAALPRLCFTPLAQHGLEGGRWGGLLGEALAQSCGLGCAGGFCPAEGGSAVGLYSRWRFCANQPELLYVSSHCNSLWSFGDTKRAGVWGVDVAPRPWSPEPAVSWEVMSPLLKEPVTPNYLTKLADSGEYCPKRPRWVSLFKQLCWFGSAGSQLELAGGHGMERCHV